MSDQRRWRYGDTNPVVAAVDLATVIEIGDLLWQDADNAKPASMIEPNKEKCFQCPNCGLQVPETEHTAWCSVCTMRNWNRVPSLSVPNLFAKTFLGVAMQRSRSGDTAAIRVATTGVFEFDCPSGTFELGNLVGADENAGGTALLDQQVAAVSSSSHAIGRVAKREASATTSVLIDVRSTVMTGGVEGSSPSGV